MLLRILILFFCLTSFVSAARLMIIDTDVGIDDEIAILYLLKRSDIEIKAITIACDGNAHCLPALKNTLGFLKLAHKTNIPVACGREKPLKGNHHFPEMILRESDTLANTANLLPKVDSLPRTNAVNLLIKTLQTTNQPVDILAIAPLTNLAELVITAPQLKKKIHMIYFMGGAISTLGNLADAGDQSNNKVAEWNVYLDPYAASVVFSSGIPITLVPLDVTNKLPINWQFYQKMQGLHNTPSANMVFEILKQNKKLILQKHHRWYFWDPLAAVIASDESISTFENKSLRILSKPERQSGATVIDTNHGNIIRVSKTIDQTRFKNLLINTLNS